MALNLGLAEFKQGHFRASAAALGVAFAADPSNTQARSLLGLSYYGEQRFSAAIQYLEPAAKSDPGNVELHRLLAQSCLLAKNYSCALDEFRQLLQLSPDSAAAHVLTGEALDGLGRTSEAITEFEAAAKISPREFLVGQAFLHNRIFIENVRQQRRCPFARIPACFRNAGDIGRNFLENGLNFLVGIPASRLVFENQISPHAAAGKVFDPVVIFRAVSMSVEMPGAVVADVFQEFHQPECRLGIG